uniref:Uncharacterized protein n=1 Tax=Ciona intestinalis TaxID=7719 RepID=H2XKS4_CIOIN
DSICRLFLRTRSPFRPSSVFLSRFLTRIYRTPSADYFCELVLTRFANIIRELHSYSQRHNRTHFHRRFILVWAASHHIYANLWVIVCFFLCMTVIWTTHK